VQRKLEELPNKPGCYLMWDEHAKVLYVGKALVLRHRVRSYFQSSAKHAQRIHEMVAKVRNISWWVTPTEMEALILENDLIKRYQPHYNVMLKDDKGYPYIKVNWQNDFPKVERVRLTKDDGARYFGPFTSSWAVSRTLESMRKVFPYLDCDRTISGNDESPCLYYHLKLCGGPCIGVQSRTEYREGISQLIDFLEGDTDAVMNQLETRMGNAAERFNFELAAVYRDRIRAAQRIVHQQKVVGVQNDDEDVVAIAQDAKSSDTVVQILMVRRGRLIGRENFALQGVELSETTAENLGDLIGIFIQRFYADTSHVPPRLLVQFVPGTKDLLAAWLSKLRGAKVEIRMPQRGKKTQTDGVRKKQCRGVSASAEGPMGRRHQPSN
jgi:excinuclease ABC subunit C